MWNCACKHIYTYIHVEWRPFELCLIGLSPENGRTTYSFAYTPLREYVASNPFKCLPLPVNSCHLQLSPFSFSSNLTQPCIPFSSFLPIFTEPVVITIIVQVSHSLHHRDQQLGPPLAIPLFTDFSFLLCPRPLTLYSYDLRSTQLLYLLFATEPFFFLHSFQCLRQLS